MKTVLLRFNHQELNVLMQSLDAILWEALPDWHDDKKAAKIAKAKLHEGKMSLIRREGST